MDFSSLYIRFLLWVLEEQEHSQQNCMRSIEKLRSLLLLKAKNILMRVICVAGQEHTFIILSLTPALMWQVEVSQYSRRTAHLQFPCLLKKGSRTKRRWENPPLEISLVVRVCLALTVRCFQDVRCEMVSIGARTKFLTCQHIFMSKNERQRNVYRIYMSVSATGSHASFYYPTLPDF